MRSRDPQKLTSLSSAIQLLTSASAVAGGQHNAPASRADCVLIEAAGKAAAVLAGHDHPSRPIHDSGVSRTVLARDGSSSSAMPVDIGNQLTKDQAAVVPGRPQATHTGSGQQAGNSRPGSNSSSSNGRKAWDVSIQERLVAQTQLQPKMQQLNLSGASGTAGMQDKAPAQSSQLAAPSSSAAIGTSRSVSGTTIAAAQKQHQQQKAPSQSAAMPASRSSARPEANQSSSSSNSSLVKQGAQPLQRLQCLPWR